MLRSPISTFIFYYSFCPAKKLTVVSHFLTAVSAPGQTISIRIQSIWFYETVAHWLLKGSSAEPLHSKGALTAGSEET
jgi:hypothetical protein